MIWDTKTKKSNGTITDKIKKAFNQTKLVPKEVTKDLSDEVNRLFLSFDKKGNFFEQIDGKMDAIEDPAFKEFADNMLSTASASLTAGEAMKKFSTQTVYVEEKVSLAKTAFEKLKGAGVAVGATLGNIAISLAATWVASKIFEAIDDAIHRSEILIEKGQEAQQAIEDAKNAYDSTKSSVEDVKDRYVELAPGVDTKNNKNMSLSTDEYEEFLSINNQLAELFPELVTGYDSQGNAITSLGSNADSATEQLAALLEQKRQLADYKIAENLQDNFNGVLEQSKNYEENLEKMYKERKRLEDEKAEYEAIEGYSSGKINLNFEKVGESYFDEYLGEELNTYQRIVDITQTGFQERLAAAYAAAQEAGIEFYNAMGSVEDGLNTEVWQFLNASDDQMEVFYESYARNLKGKFKEANLDVSAELNELYGNINIDEREMKSIWNQFVPSLISSLSIYDGYDEFSDELQQMISTAVGNIDYTSLEEADQQNIRQYARRTFLDPILDMDDDTRTAFDNIIDIYTDGTLSFQERIRKMSEIFQKDGDLYEQSKSFFSSLGIMDDKNGIDFTGGKMQEVLLRENNYLSKDELLSLNDKQFEYVYDLVINKGTVVDDIDKIIRDFERLENAADSSAETVKFSSLFKTAEGEDTDFSKNVDEFQSDIDTIQEAINSLAAGEKVDTTDLVQQFGELAGQTDNLGASLANLKADKIKEFSAEWKAGIKEITDPEQLEAASNFYKNLLADIDLTNIDFDKVSDALNSAFMPETMGSDYDSREAANAAIRKAQLIKETFANELQTEEGREIIYKISLDPSMDDATTAKWREEYDAYAKLMNNSVITGLQNDMTTLQSEASELEDTLSLKEARGVKKVAKDYSKLVTNSAKQIKNLQKQNDELEEGKKNVKETSDEYYNIQKQIDDNNSSIRSLVLSQIEWNDNISNLPVDNVQALSSAISSALDEMNSGTGITTDTMDTIITQFSDLEGMDTDDIFYRTSEGIKVNTSRLRDFAEAENDVVERDFANQIKALNEEIANGSSEAQDQLEIVLDRQAQYFAEYQKQMEYLSKYNQIAIAEGTENQGAHYDSMKSRLESWKDMYDKGLIGTDDFKSISSYFNEYGLSTYENFEKDYKKAKRYLTEDSSGVTNFINDLISNGLAFEDEAGNIIMDFQDISDAAHKMDIGDEFFRDMFGKADEYGGVGTFISSLTDANLQTQDLSEQLYQAQKDMIELNSIGADETAIQQKQAEIDSLKEQLRSVDDGTKAYIENKKQDYVEGFENLKDTLWQYRTNFYDAKSRGDEAGMQKWLNDAQELADEYGITITNFKVDEDSYQAALDKMYPEKGSWENPIERSFSGDAATNYASAYEKVVNAHKEDNTVLEEATDTLSKYTAEQLKSIDLSDGQYDGTFEGATEAEMALDSLATELGLSTDEAQMLWAVLESVGQTKVEPVVEFEDEKLQNGLEELQKLQEDGEITVDIDFDADTSSMSLDELNDRMEILASINVDENSDAYATLQRLISDTQVQINVQTMLENGYTVDQLLEMADEGTLQTEIQCDDEQLQNVVDSLNTVKEGATVPVTVQLDETQFNALSGNTEEKEIPVKTGEVDDTTVQKYDPEQDEIPIKTGEVDDTTVRKYDPLTETIPVKTGIVDTTTITDLRNSIARNPIIQEVKIKKVGEGSSSSSSTTSTGGAVPAALGTAHASGTVLSMWQVYRHSIGAYANGTSQDWALPHDETALVNEVGTESIVRDGRWFPIPGGAHVEQLRRGDIVFNSDQTTELIKYGRVISNGGHGKVALANGTAYNMMPAHGASTAGYKITKKTKIHPNSDYPNTDDDKKKKGGGGNGGGGDTTAATKKTIQAFDWVAVKLQYFADKTKEIADTITDYVSYTFSNKQLNQQIKAVQREQTENKNGYNAYMAKADSVAQGYKYYTDKGQTINVKIPEEYIKKVQEGKYKIEDMDTSTDEKKALAEAVQSYQDYYEKAKQCAETTRELAQTEKELRVQRLENIAANYDGKVQRTQSRISNIQSSIEVDQATGKKIGTRYTAKTNADNKAALKKERKEIQSQIEQSQYEEANLRVQKNNLKVQLKTTKDKNEKKEIQAQIVDVDNKLKNNKADQNTLNTKLINTPDVYQEYKDNRGKLKSNLKAAQNEGRDLANRKEVLQNRLSVTTNKKERRSITAQIKDVDTRIANNKGKQSDLNNQLANLKDPNKKATSKSEKSQYKALISASKDQEKYLGDKKNSVQKEFDELVNNGTIKKGSSEWYKWKEELAGIDDEINQCKVDQAEWNEYIANIPINKLKDANDRLQVSADQKQRNISIKEARGGMASADDYNGLIKNSKAQNKNLKEQNKLLEAQRDKYDKGTDKWKEYQEQIDANTEAIDNNIESMINWTNEIVNLPFEKRDKKLEKNQDKRDVYDSNYSVAEDSKSKNKILNKQDSLAKSDLKIYQDTKKEADVNVKKYTKNAQKYGVFDTEANKGKKAGQKLSVAGLEKGSDAYNAVVAYNKALEAQKDAEKDVKIATDEATKTLQENAKSRFDNVVADYEGDLNVSSSEQGLTQSKMDYRTASGKVSKYNTSLLTDTLTEQNESLDIQREQLAKAKEAYKKNKNSMSEEDRKAAEASLLDMEAKINDTKTAIIETQNAIDNMPLEKKQDALEKLETQAEKLEDAMSLSDVRGIDATANDYKNLINNSDEQVTNLQEQNVELRKQQEGLSKTSENYLELQKQIDENDAAIRKAEISQEEWNNAIIALPIDKLEKELDLLDSIAALNKSRVDLKSAEGKDLSESDYLQQIQDNSDQVANWQDKSHEYYLNMLQAQKSADGVYGGKTAEEWQQEMNNANTQANNLLATNEQLKDSLRDDVYWRDFERAHEAVQRTKSEIEGIAGLISDDMIYDSDGKLTDFGISKVATLVEQYELASEEVQNYQDDLKNLDDLYASGEYTEEEYKAKLAELKDGLLDSASAMKDYTDTIVDMYKEMGQAELDALFELIDTRKEALDAKKSYYDFDKTIRDKNKDIESLKARKAALEGIDTAQARAELAQLNADLQDTEDDLNDTMFEHQMELSQEVLDGMKDAMQDAFDDKWETVHSDLGEISELMDAANTLTVGSSRDINANLEALLKHYGVNPATSHLDTVGSFANGTRRVGASGYARTQEDGGEIVLKDGSVLLPVEPNDSIIPAKLTDNILAMAKDYPFLQNPKLMQPNLYMTAEAAGANVSVSFNNLINVESGGVIDKYVVDDVSSLTKALVKDKSFMNATYQYTTKEIVRDAKKAGISAR